MHMANPNLSEEGKNSLLLVKRILELQGEGHGAERVEKLGKLMPCTIHANLNLKSI